MSLLDLRKQALTKTMVRLYRLDPDTVLTSDEHVQVISDLVTVLAERWPQAFDAFEKVLVHNHEVPDAVPWEEQP